MRRSVASLRLFLSAALILSVTVAQSAPERIGSLAVRFSDLDLRNDGDVQVLLGRLERAAYTACGGDARFHPSYAIMPHYTRAVFLKCRYDAVARAVATIDAPKLVSAFEAQTERTAAASPHLSQSGDAEDKAGT